MKRLVIGDIHGCFIELMELIDKAGLSEEDEIIALGDIVDRGPDSFSVVEFFMQTPKASSLMGNHEKKHIRISNHEAEPSIAQYLTQKQITQRHYHRAINFFLALPLFRELHDAMLIHGLYEPGVPLQEQKERVLLGTMSGEKYIKRSYPGSWYEHYKGEKPLIAGHHHYSREGKPLIFNDRVFLIDTGCCFGFSLTGILLPDFKMLSIKSRAHYWSKEVQSYRRQLKK